MSTARGFDYNQWQAMNLQPLAASAAAETETPESVTQGGLDQLLQNAFRLFGVNPDLKGHPAIAPETNVGGGLSLQNAAIVKDRPGGVLAGILRYFTRELPHGLTGTDGEAAGISAPAHGELTGPADSGPETFAASLPPGVRQQALAYGLQAAEAVDVPLERLGSLAPPDTPDIARRGVEIGIAA